MLLSCRPFVVITTFQQDLEPSQETEVTLTPTRPVENVVITTKGLQERNSLLLDGRTVENKGKLILTDSKEFQMLKLRPIRSKKLILRNSKCRNYVQVPKKYRYQEYRNKKMVALTDEQRRAH